MVRSWLTTAPLTESRNSSFYNSLKGLWDIIIFFFGFFAKGVLPIPGCFGDVDDEEPWSWGVPGTGGRESEEGVALLLSGDSSSITITLGRSCCPGNQDSKCSDSRRAFNEAYSSATFEFVCRMAVFAEGVEGTLGCERWNVGAVLAADSVFSSWVDCGGGLTCVGVASTGALLSWKRVRPALIQVAPWWVQFSNETVLEKRTKTELGLGPDDGPAPPLLSR